MRKFKSVLADAYTAFCYLIYTGIFVYCCIKGLQYFFPQTTIASLEQIRETFIERIIFTIGLLYILTFMIAMQIGRESNALSAAERRLIQASREGKRILVFDLSQITHSDSEK